MVRLVKNEKETTSNTIKIRTAGTESAPDHSSILIFKTFISQTLSVKCKEKMKISKRNF